MTPTTDDDDASSVNWTMSGPNVRGRSCGSCTACCTQLPTADPLGRGQKPANTRCTWQLSTGCKHYERRPYECRVWSCAWLIQAGTHELKRPDRAGYVIDTALDTLMINGQAGPAVQIWVDPKRRDSYCAPELRRWLESIRLVALVRFDSRECRVLVPSSLTASGEWYEADHGVTVERAELNAMIEAVTP